MENENFCPNCSCSSCKEAKQRELFWLKEEAASRMRWQLGIPANSCGIIKGEITLKMVSKKDGP